MKPSTLRTSFRFVSVLVATLLSACGGAGGAGGGGGGGDGWYYHWSCNGDPECLATNPTGQPAGTVGPEAGGQIGCESLMTFGSHFWGIPPATQACDNSPNTPPATLVSITVDPGARALPLGRTQQYTATGHYSDGTSRDITGQVTWSVRCGASGFGLCDPGPPATIDAGGLATAVAIGSVTVHASLGSVVGSATLNVTSAVLVSITVSPSSPTINQFATQQFTATGHYSDGTSQIIPSASWTSATTATATIDAATGIATGVAAGTSMITASFKGISGSTLLTVSPVALLSIAVTPANPSVAKGLTLQLTARGTYSDGGVRDVTRQVTWEAQTPAIVTVTGGGLVTGANLGSSAVNASLAGVTGGTTVAVTDAILQSIVVTPANPAVETGLTVQLTATGVYSDGSTLDLTTQVTWSSSALSVATVSGTGLASGVAGGTSSIGAALGGISGGTSLTVYALGSRWAPVTGGAGGGSGTSSALLGIAWTGTRFAAVGAAGTVLTSPDGMAWTLQSSGTSADLLAVVWTGTQLVAVGSGGTALTSPDGITWTARPTGNAFDLYAVIWTGTQLVAVGSSPTSLTSPDGITWTAVSPSVLPYQQALSIGWDGTSYYVGTLTVSNYVNYYPEFYDSTDLQHFTYLGNVAGRYSYGMLWTGTQLIVVQSGGVILTFQDGTWAGRTSGTTSALRAAAWTTSELSRPQYVIVGDGGTILTSPDSVSWTVRTSGSSSVLRAVAWSGKHFVAVGDAGTILFTSP